MTNALDTYPLDFSQPAVQDLRRRLIDTFDTQDMISGLLKLSGIHAGGINTARAPDAVWTDVLGTARKQDKLRVLLTVAAGDPNAAAIRPLLDSLLSSLVAETAASPTPTEDGTGDIEWKVEGADAAGLERQIESQSTLLDVSFLERGLELSASVAKLIVGLNDGKRYYGTAFRIGPDLLLTNHHVLFDKVGRATHVEAWFGYERSFLGAERAHTILPCTAESVVGREDHDWAVVRTAAPIPAEAAIIPLVGAPAPTALDRVYIIQHPKGEPKKIGMVHNVVTNVTDDVVQYRTDTDGGSSGSPVFNEQWQVVAVHHRWGSTVKGGRTEYYNQGRRIERVVEGLDAEGVL